MLLASLPFQSCPPASCLEPQDGCSFNCLVTVRENPNNVNQLNEDQQLPSTALIVWENKVLFDVSYFSYVFVSDILWFHIISHGSQKDSEPLSSQDLA